MGSVSTLPSSVKQPSGGLRKQFRPSERVKEEWRLEAKRLGYRGYVQRWSAFWGKVVRATEAYGPVASVDMTLVEEYVRRCRLAEAHLREALNNPYTTMASGFVQAHPGFAQSRSEAKVARDVADALGLTPYARRRAGVLPPVDPNGEDDEPSEEAPAWTDDQTDSEGKPL